MAVIHMILRFAKRTAQSSTSGGDCACKITSMVAAMDLVAPGTAVIAEVEFGYGLAQQQTVVGAGRRVRAALPSPRSPCGQIDIDDGVAAEGGEDPSRGKLRLVVLKERMSLILSFSRRMTSQDHC
jgi:hypothetical protein